MTEKCFCHFNGYKVKDAEARKDIEDLKVAVDTANHSADDAYDYAGRAFDTANNAHYYAENVKAAADNAQATADAAQVLANNAQTAADTAQASANNAQTAADTAQASANNAQTAADAAHTSINQKTQVINGFLHCSANVGILNQSNAGFNIHRQGNVIFINGSITLTSTDPNSDYFTITLNDENNIFLPPKEETYFLIHTWAVHTGGNQGDSARKVLLKNNQISFTSKSWYGDDLAQLNVFLDLCYIGDNDNVN